VIELVEITPADHRGGHSNGQLCRWDGVWGPKPGELPVRVAAGKWLRRRGTRSGDRPPRRTL